MYKALSNDMTAKYLSWTLYHRCVLVGELRQAFLLNLAHQWIHFTAPLSYQTHTLTILLLPTSPSRLRHDEALHNHLRSYPRSVRLRHASSHRAAEPSLRRTEQSLRKRPQV